jgi:phospholipid transport system substrate-binding protein
MRKIWLYGSLLALPLAAVPALAQTAGDGASAAAASSPAQAQSAGQFIQGIADNALNSIAGKRLSNDETTERFRTLLRQAFDLKSIGRYVLGPYYNSATPEQREDYQTAFENMIVDAYALRFRDYSGGSLKTGREIPQGKDTLVESQIDQGNGAPPINVTWRIRAEGGGYKIIDVAVEGVSMGQTERSEFSAYIERNGGKIQPLIDAIKNHQIGLQNEDAQGQK